MPYLVATEPEMVDGRFTGRARGTPCFQAGKITRVDQWLASRGRTLASFADSWFYSDSLNDLPLLERVRHPVAVDPDPQAGRGRRARGWPVISLR